MPLIDSHCHLEAKDFQRADGSDEREDVLARARAAGVEAFVCVGSGAGLDEVRTAVAMAETHADIWAAVGIHPHDTGRTPAGAMAEIERLATDHPRVVCVGETGLDYHYMHSQKDEQQRGLADFIAIAKRAKKPLSLHVRDAHDDTLRILEAGGAREVGGVVHCFTGDVADAKRYIELGFHISLSGVVTFKSAVNIREAAAWAPLDRLLVETDCPFLAPVPLRGKRNEPAYVTHTAQVVASLRGIDYEDFAAATTRNARALFRI
ncbi:MAG TPA: TatD family hydrolase [Polyangia bacterium]|jgi:TatD DNase family protein|nr:TatD family hydrolase [Polyangia bacterium]